MSFIKFFVSTLFYEYRNDLSVIRVKPSGQYFVDPCRVILYNFSFISNDLFVQMTILSHHVAKTELLF